MTVCIRCQITGHVQGVYYRASTRREAERLGVSGYARNLENGAVEVLACGPKQAVDELCVWLETGPKHAQVSKVVREQIEPEQESRRGPAFVIE
ncbi:MAG: acylphosphatase [Ectothiorhodospiraceae bacterium]|nr:acylphosphatase [Ectothiorhodospiraceae bacterium]